MNAATVQMCKATAQAELSLPGMVADGFGLASLPDAEELLKRGG